MRAFIFPGQGIQKSGMAKDLILHFPKAVSILKEADLILGRNLSRLMIEGSELELGEPLNAQPAIFLYQFILSSLQKEISADIVSGHSFGEFAALVLAGVIEFREALELVNKRAFLGQQFSDKFQACMCAVIGLDREIIEELILQTNQKLKFRTYLVNYNGPGQYVVSGEKEGIIELCRVLRANGAKRAVVLPINGAYHTPLMYDFSLKFGHYIDQVKFTKPEIPICQCADSNINNDTILIKSNLKNHMIYPVDWTKMINVMVDYGVKEFVEVGTDDTLQKIVKRMYPNLKVYSILDIRTYREKIYNYGRQ
jgi:[acyl-carrier-protein] S-malonyltransferase